MCVALFLLNCVAYAFRTEFKFLCGTELPFTRGSFAAEVRDHDLREASHLYYEGKE